jgi:hypothetical protein
MKCKEAGENCIMRSFITCTLCQEESVYRVLMGKPEGKILIGTPRRRWSMVLKQILKKEDEGCGLDLSGSG